MKNEARIDRFVTIPNIICLLRMLGSIVLVVLAVNGRDQVFLWLFVGLAMSDWVDGKLASLLNQRSVWGPSLDSWADAALYLALLIGAVLLRGDVLQFRNCSGSCQRWAATHFLPLLVIGNIGAGQATIPAPPRLRGFLF